jgi:hypothetical protein
VANRLVKITTALAVVAVAGVAAIISYQHAYKLVRSHGESGVTVRLLPLTRCATNRAVSMLVLERAAKPACAAAGGVEPGHGHRGGG